MLPFAVGPLPHFLPAQQSGDHASRFPIRLLPGLLA